ncbi:MAG: NEW3 domain-containing protein [Thermoguttaceae bacterium]
MNLLLTLLIVAANPHASIAEGLEKGTVPNSTPASPQEMRRPLQGDSPLFEVRPGAAQVFHTRFDRAADINYDGWPDGWTRRRGLGFPPYVRIEIRNEAAPGGGRALAIALDGAGGIAYSPPVAVEPDYDLVAQAFVKTEGVAHDRAWLSLTLRDAEHRTLESFTSEKVGQTAGWQKLCLGPVSPKSNLVRSAVLGLHLEPGDREDLKATARFAELQLCRLPQLTLTLNRPLHFFTTEDKVAATCQVSNPLPNGDPVVFELLDENARTIARCERRLSPLAEAGPQMSAEASALVRGGSATRGGKVDPSRGNSTTRRVSVAQWSPPIPGPGFYRLAVTMKAAGQTVGRRERTLVVAEPSGNRSGGEFGWTLSRGNRPLGLPLLADLIAQAGIRWVKYPLWIEAETKESEISQLIEFRQRLALREIEMIGLLDQPPAPLRKRFAKGIPPTAVDLFAAGPEIWGPSLEPALSHMGALVRWWQVGADEDTSFVGYSGAAAKLAAVKASLDRLGPGVSMGMGWDWKDPLPKPEQAPRKVAAEALPQPAGKPAVRTVVAAAHVQTPSRIAPPWRFVSLAADPAISERELAGYLEATQRWGVRRLVTLDPQPRTGRRPADRAADFARRMIVAKARGAEGIFARDPFNTERGLMNDDGTPGELFLPWRTVAGTLGGAKPLGSIELPGGSTNYVFARGRDAAMALWNGHPVQETIDFGDDVRQVDLWGRPQTISGPTSQRAIEVGPLPTLVTGLNRAVAAWCAGLVVEHDRLPSVAGRRHKNQFQVANRFERGVEGSVELIGPQDWTVTPRRSTFRLAAGEVLKQPLSITLPPNATAGPHTIRADFHIQAGPAYHFSVRRTIHVGLDDLRVEIATHLDDSGDLKVTQRVMNETDHKVNFRCRLFAPDRRVVSSEIRSAARGCETRVYHLANGGELLGKTLWLEAEDMDGPRVLNYRFVAGK